MKVYCEGVALIRHQDTSVIYEIDGDEIEWDAVGGDERSMGTQIQYEAILDHPQLGNLIWTIWEYPVGVQNNLNTNVNDHELLNDFKYGLRHEEDPYDEWFNYEVPSDPFSVFMDSFYETGDLLADHGKDDGGALINRLVFSHQVTALEAYLGDTLMNAVAGDTTAMQRLISGDKELSSIKISLTDISNDNNIVINNVRKYLKELMYHNIAKIDVIYNMTLGINILKLTSNKDELFKAINLRHDCVHRNGFDKNGNKLDVFTKSFVKYISNLIHDFVEDIEDAVQKKSKS